MKITERDIELMGWILEQKFMPRKQIRKIFWKGVSETSVEDYRRLSELRSSGYLKASKEDEYKEALYLVTAKGVRTLREFGRNRGLGELNGAGYSNYKHDLTVTDIQILFHVLGYKDWVSERVLSKRNDLKQIPDGLIYHKDKYFAIEYESSQKSKRRYEKIFLDYELDRHIDKVLYVTDTIELAQRISIQADTYDKPYFVWLGEIQKETIHARVKNQDNECSLQEIFETSNSPKPLFLGSNPI